MYVVGMACGIGPEVMNKDLVMIHARKIPSTFINFKTTVSSACKCKLQCFIIPDCLCITAEIINITSVSCQGSYEDVPYTSLEDNNNTFTFYWRKYERVGNWYYRVGLEEASWFDASMVCYAEGGQLMVAHSDLLQQHLISLFNSHGYKLHIHYNKEVMGNRCFAAYIDMSVTKVVFSNVEFCGVLQSYICQRNY
ncbi:hypothetical protein Pmani_030303 [Petrolisthes manimaculis]|uniref:C-type lectin domain-containing protein n=1 Tax=Petrolisthes manimaculis TaxID=1843537 RepID=A0AAE1TW30_9EUCA|nr:hypothetical protein Pmani_030303 [Petrolisthes manimaculis]